MCSETIIQLLGENEKNNVYIFVSVHIREERYTKIQIAVSLCENSPR